MSLLVDFATRQLGLAQEQLVMLGKGSAEERVLFFLTTWRDRTASLKPFQQYLPLPMMRQDIADFLGLRLETLSRTLAKLAWLQGISPTPTHAPPRTSRPVLTAATLNSQNSD